MVRRRHAPDAPDAELLDAARAGDRDALEALLRRHQPRIHAVCRRIAGTTRDADDAAQETLVKIVRSLHAFDGRSAFSTWAYRIATNTALDELRKRSRRPGLHVVGPDGDLPPDPIDERAHRDVDVIADRFAIDAALADLPEDYRVAVVLRDVADLDYDEIAAVLDVPVGTVKSRIARGRARLVGALGNQDPPERRPTDRP